MSRQSRALKAIGIVMIMFAFGTLLCGLALLIASNGRPVDFVQTAVIRLRLEGRQADLERTISNDDTPVRFVVNSGETPRTIAANLVKNNLIRDAELFVDYVRVSELDSQLEAGTYFLTQAQTIPQIAVLLTDSRSSQFPFRILEGWRMEEIADIIDRSAYFNFSGADFLAVVGAGASHDPTFAAYVGLPAGASLEGFLFPDTYQIPAVVTPIMLRDILTTQFRAQIGTDLQSAAAAQNMTLYEAVTLASIIQREAVRADEHPRISSVYRNRMSINMKLDADPTVQYGIGFRDGTWWPQITQANYSNVISPYNTYLNIGLPPGPIASPGASAIRAAIYPEQTPYYFFRARCDGSGYHEFAVDFAGHLANACP